MDTRRGRGTFRGRRGCGVCGGAGVLRGRCYSERLEMGNISQVEHVRFKERLPSFLVMGFIYSMLIVQVRTMEELHCLFQIVELGDLRTYMQQDPWRCFITSKARVCNLLCALTIETIMI